MDLHSKMTNHLGTDPKEEGIKKEGPYPPVANTTRKRGVPTTLANSDMSAEGAEEITHDTGVLPRPSKQIWLGQWVDQTINGSWPHFLRFAFGRHDIGRTPSAMYTESAQPIPGVPQGDYKYSDITSTIATHPQLFRIVTLIRVDRFEELLVHHPNRPLVESVCHGLHVGFWPFANTADPALQPLSIVD